MRLNTGCLRGESTFRPGFTSPRPDDSSGCQGRTPAPALQLYLLRAWEAFDAVTSTQPRHGAHPLCSEEPRSTQTSGFHPETVCWGFTAFMTLAFLSAKQTR